MTHPARALALVAVALFATTAIPNEGRAQDPCRDVFADALCGTVENADALPEEVCRTVLAAAHCDTMAEQSCSADDLARCGANSATPAHEAVCDALDTSLAGGCLQWSREFPRATVAAVSAERLAMFSSFGRTLDVLDAQTGETLWTSTVLYFSAAAFDPTGERLAIAGRYRSTDSTAQLVMYDAPTGALLWSASLSPWVSMISFSSDGTVVAAAGATPGTPYPHNHSTYYPPYYYVHEHTHYDARFALFSASDGSPGRAVTHPGYMDVTDFISALTLLPDEGVVASVRSTDYYSYYSSRSGTVVHFRPDGTTATWRPPGPQVDIRGVSVVSDGAFALVRWEDISTYSGYPIDSKLALLDLADLSTVWQRNASDESAALISSDALSPDGATYYYTVMGRYPSTAAALVALDPLDGAQRWTETHTTLNSNDHQKVLVTPDGSRIVEERFLSDDGWRGNTSLLFRDAATGVLLRNLTQAYSTESRPPPATMTPGSLVIQQRSEVGGLRAWDTGLLLPAVDPGRAPVSGR